MIHNWCNRWLFILTTARHVWENKIYYLKSILKPFILLFKAQTAVIGVISYYILIFIAEFPLTDSIHACEFDEVYYNCALHNKVTL